MTTGTKILVIDDDAVDRANVARLLRASDMPFDLVQAADGATGLELAKNGAFDCVLLDYRLPDVDAGDLLAQLISTEIGGHAVIMLTGESNPDIAMKLMRAGALDYLGKGDITSSSLTRSIRFATARKQFLHEMEEKSAELAILNRQKSLLLSIIAHDLRNPFQALLGLSQSLANKIAAGDLSTAEIRAQGIHQAAARAHKLTEDLLEWANLQMDSRAIPMASVDLGDVAAEAVKDCREVARQKQIEIVLGCAGVIVNSHRPTLIAILRNLIGNAIKFTGPGGRVEVMAVPNSDSSVELMVTDTGVGIPPEAIADLFSVDRRATTTGTAGERGSGLGLLLCQELARRLGSELRVSSTLGQGATFQMTL